MRLFETLICELLKLKSSRYYIILNSGICIIYMTLSHSLNQWPRDGQLRKMQEA